MSVEDVKTKISEALKEMDCTDIAFTNIDSKSITVIFNCKDLTSFKAQLEGWNYSGIVLNTDGKQQYKIVFIKS